jgi:hypothetical protein
LPEGHDNIHSASYFLSASFSLLFALSSQPSALFFHPARLTGGQAMSYQLSAFYVCVRLFTPLNAKPIYLGRLINILLIP